MPELHPVPDKAGSLPLPPSGLDYADELILALRNALDKIMKLSGVVYDDANDNSSAVVFVGWNKWQWATLPDEAAPHVGKARDALQRLHEFSSNVARNAPDRLDDLKELEEVFERMIEQPGGTYPNGAPESTIEEVRNFVDAKLAEYPEIVRKLPSAYGNDERLLVADTSALLDRPDLQNWILDGTAWTVVFMPQVHSELDDRKRDTRTREPAQKVIRQIEELDRRGDTFAGVPLAGKLAAREVPTSPDMSRTLPWLRSDVPDDAIIAGALELRWQDLTSRIAVVASDRNVRNKARLAGLGALRATDI